MKNNSFGVTKLIVSVLIFHLNRCGAICIFKKIRGFYPRTPALPRTPASRGSGVWAPAAPKPGIGPSGHTVVETEPPGPPLRTPPLFRGCSRRVISGDLGSERVSVI